MFLVYYFEQYFQKLPLCLFSANNVTEIFESFDNLSPAALMSAVDNSTVCLRKPIMGTIVTDAAPYLYPFIIEYSLIGAAVIYVMWKHIGRYPRYVVSWFATLLKKLNHIPCKSLMIFRL